MQENHKLDFMGRKLLLTFSTFFKIGKLLNRNFFLTGFSKNKSTIYPKKVKFHKQ